MAPEQLRGEPTSTSSDIYSFGAVLFEMATGQRPFPESQIAKFIDALLHQPPEPPSSLNPNISASLDEIVLKAM